jgi:lipopolysaccharide export system protein LptA
LVARQNVQLDLPADAAGTAKRIRSVSLDASGPPDRGLTAARFVDNVEFRETRPATKDAPAIDRTARSRTLDSTVQPGFGAIEAATFAGGVTFSEATREGAASDAVYAPAKSSLQLVASPGATTLARVDDTRATVQARKIDLKLEGGGMVADTDVRSVMKSSGDARTAKPGAPAPARRPGMLRENQPVNVTAKHLVYDDATDKAVYTGEARLWQGETAIQADTITIDDTRGDLVAHGKVRSTLRLSQTNPKTGASEPSTTVITSDHMVYQDTDRRATYTGTPRLNGPEGDLRAEKIELYLDETGSALEKLEAYVNVSLTSAARAASGARLTYFAADERYLMSGTPVRILEQLPQECRETIGRTLTFFRSTDSISVDGNDETRTQTTSGGKCPESKVK